MLRRAFASIGIVSLLTVGLAACGAPPAPQPLSAIELPFLGESVMGSIEGEEYRYFRYASVEAALVDKAKISSDGKMIGDTQVAWEGSIHIFHLAKRIVIYVGDTPKVLDVIEQIFGSQIAGDTSPQIQASSESSPEANSEE